MREETYDVPSWPNLTIPFLHSPTVQMAVKHRARDIADWLQAKGAEPNVQTLIMIEQFF